MPYLVYSIRLYCTVLYIVLYLYMVCVLYSNLQKNARKKVTTWACKSTVHLQLLYSTYKFESTTSTYKYCTALGKEQLWTTTKEYDKWRKASSSSAHSTYYDWSYSENSVKKRRSNINISGEHREYTHSITLERILARLYNQFELNITSINHGSNQTSKWALTTYWICNKLN